jgi:hypothetical protein
MVNRAQTRNIPIIHRLGASISGSMTIAITAEQT